MRTRRTPVVLVLLTTLAAGGCGASTEESGSGSARPAASAPEAGGCPFSGTIEAKSGRADAPVMLLTDVRVGTHGCFERVVFELRPREGEAGAPLGYTVVYQPAPITQDGSGEPVEVEGAAFLVVRLTAMGVDLTKPDAPPTYLGPGVLNPPTTTRIRQLRRVGDFEGVLTWAIGLDATRPFAVSTQESPARLLVDIGD